MTNHKDARAHYPHIYPPPTSLRLPTGVIRLFGVNWAFAVGGTSAALTDGDGEIFTVDRIYGGDPGRIAAENFPFHQNYFTLDLYERYDPSTYTDCFPVIGTAAAAATLRVQKIDAPGTGNNKLLRQLLLGRILVPAAPKRSELLALMRQRLGLGPPKGQEQLEIILDPDGFAIHAAYQPPWEAAPINGWFKLVGGRPDVGKLAIEPGLRLCLDADVPDAAAMRSAWAASIARFASLIDRGAKQGPQWLTLDAAASIAPENLFWPCRREKANHNPSDVYAQRRASDPLHVTERPVTLRLAPGRTAEQRLGALEIGPERLIVARDPAGVRIKSGSAQRAPLLAYGFVRGATGNAEWIDLGGEPEEGKPRRLELAVPLAETARYMRAASGLPARDLAAEAALAGGAIDAVGPLWTFAPIEQGLLHFPFPDATLEGLETLLEASSALKDPGEEAAPAAPDGDISGALLLGNDASMPGFAACHRNWHLALTGAAGAAFELVFAPGTGAPWALTRADLNVAGANIELAGAFPIIPFAQTSERLLPDHDERAARLTAIRAVSSTQLRGIEARMWRMAGAYPDAPFVRAKLSVLGFRLTPPASATASIGLTGKVQLETRIASRRAGGGTGDRALRPWLWTRHARLATAQTHPLALSGEAVSAPSGSLELFPLVRASAKDNFLYSLENALDMGLMTPRLIIDPASSGGPAYRAPWPDAADDQPISEVGMALLSLPSVTLHPGLTAPGDAAQIAPSGAADWRWSISPRSDAPVLIEVRHDLAWRDAFHAAAAVAAESDEDAGSAQRGRFTPLATNGPQAGDRTNWLSAWLAMQREAALAATDQRAMVLQEAAGLMLAGFVGDKRLAIADLAFSDAIALARDDSGQPLAMTAAGALTIAVKQDGNLALLGLPASDDLLGVSGTLGGDAFAFGTLDVQRGSNPSFADQAALTSGLAAQVGATTRRTVGKAILHGLSAPIVASGALAPIHLWFVDVPEGDLGAAPLSWLTAEEDHRQGLRWAILSPASSHPDWIEVASGIWFRALELAACKVDASGQLKLTLTGMLGVQDSDRILEEIAPSAAAPARLVLASAADGQWTWTFHRPDTALLPLERGEGDAPPALLRLSDDGSDALLFQMFGETFDIALGGDEAQDGRFAAAAPKAPGPGLEIGLARADVRLGGPRPLIHVAWDFAFVASLATRIELTLTGTLCHPRYRDPGAPSLAALTLAERGARVTFDMTISTPEMAGGVVAFALAATPAADFDAQASWLSRFAPAAGRGALIALLQRSDTGFRCRDFELDVEIDLVGGIDTVPLLRLLVEARGRGGSSMRIDGEWSVDCAVLASAYRHQVALRFDGSIVPSIAAAVRLTAHARHRLAVSGEEIAFALVQPVHVHADDIDVSCALLVSAGEGAAARVALLPAHEKAGVAAAPWIAPMPPVAPAARRAAAQKLAAALAAGEAGWTDRLAEGTAQLVAPTGGEPLVDFARFVAQAPHPSFYGLLFPAAWAMDTRLSTRDYGFYLERLVAHLGSLLVEAPGQFLVPGRRRGYRLVGPDVLGEALATLAAQTSVPLDKMVPDDPALTLWAQRLKTTAARWADVALLHFYDAAGARRACVIASAPPHRPLADFGDRRWQSHAPAFADPRRVALPDAAATPGAHYLPEASTARHLAHATSAAGVETDADPALSAAALERHWSLRAGEDGAFYSQARDYWLSSRARTLYRALPSASWRLVAAMDGEAQHAAARAFVPSTPLLAGARVAGAGAGRAAATCYAPARVMIRDIAGRAGARQVRRLGLSEGGGEGAPIAASEVPFHARTPRPPIIARHDRPRASDFEARTIAASLHPEALLYASRTDAPGAAVPENALTRAPRSRSAALARLVEPAGGLLDAHWNGRLAIEIEPLDPGVPTPDWKPVRMRASVGGFDFTLELGDAAGEIDASGVRRFTFRDLPRAADAARAIDTSPRLVDHLAGLALSQSVRVECEMDGGREEGLPLRRLAVFDLLAMPGRRAAETPILLRFQDPAYDDMLSLPAKMIESAGRLFCADRAHVRMRDRFHVAWRDVKDAAASPPDALVLEVTRMVRGAGGELEPHRIPLDPVPMDKLDGEAAAIAIVDCARLTATPPPPDTASKIVFTGLLEGDRLEVRDGTGADPMRLVFEVSRKEIFPANPAAFALLRLAPDGDAVSAPLQARAPKPASIELIDPRDLFSGVARFRALYQWRFFEARPPVARPEDAPPPPLYMLQKFAGDGGSHIPAALADWIILPAAA